MNNTDQMIVNLIQRHLDEIKTAAKNEDRDSLLALANDAQELALLNDLYDSTREKMNAQRRAACDLVVKAARLWVEHVASNRPEGMLVAKRFDIETVGGAHNVRTAIARALESGVTYGQAFDALEHYTGEIARRDDEDLVKLVELTDFHRDIEEIATILWQSR